MADLSAKPSGLPGWQMFLFLCVFRCVNVSLIRSYFDPDEFWQTVEPAYCTVFQPEQTCAWTWEWTRRPSSENMQNIIDSSLWGPARSFVSVLPTVLFYQLLKIFNIQSNWWISRGPMIWNAVLVAAPTDWAIAYTGVWLWGNYWALLATLISWFQAYSLVRTFANSQETMLLSVAVALTCPELFGKKSEGFRRRSSIAFFLGGLSVAIRFTSLAAFVPLGVLLALQQESFLGKVYFLVMPCAIWGAMGLFVGLLIDRCFYGFWTIPFLGNFHFNVILDRARLYGSHPSHWYFTVGLPVIAGLLLPMILLMKTRAPTVRTTPTSPSQPKIIPAEPVNELEGDKMDALKELEKLHEQLEREKQEVEERLRSLEAHRVMAQNADSRQRMAIRSLRIIVVSYLAIMSLNDHKEFRFIHPVLPLICLLSAPSIQQLVVDFGSRSVRQSAILFLIIPNLLVVLYLGRFHQSGPIHVNKAILKAALNVPNNNKTPFSIHYLTGACHSTPLYSSLHSPDVQFNTWTLDCSPSCRADPTQTCEYERFDHNPEAFVDEAYQLTACQMREDETCEKVDKIPDFIVTFTRYAEDLHLSSLGLHAIAQYPHHLKGVQLGGWEIGSTEAKWARYPITSWFQLCVEEMVVYAGGKFAA